MFIYVVLRGPRCPHTQQCVERVTAGHNTSHISCLSHMAVLAWPWLLPHLPSHLSPQSLFFQPVIGCLWVLIVLPHRPQSQPFYHSKPYSSLSCVHNKSALLHSTQPSHPPTLITFPLSLPAGSLPSSCQARRRVTSGMENYCCPVPALPSIYPQMACWF